MSLPGLKSGLSGPNLGLSGLKLTLSDFEPVLSDPSGRMNESPPRFYRTLSPPGPLPKKKKQTNSASQTNKQTTDNVPFSFFIACIIISEVVIDPFMNY